MSKPETVKLGRPREFDRDTALDAAMRVFWAKGYEGSTLADLTDAMGINRSSMYSTFGDKEALFGLAMERYGEGPLAYLHEALEKPTAREVVEALLRGCVQFLADASHPRGCLSVQGAIACGAEAEAAKVAMIEWRIKGQAEIQKRFQRARAEGDLARDVNPGDLARYVSTVMTGLGIQSANGASRGEMIRVVEMALAGLRV
jgi:AcrR family transcriptional regulator